MLVQFMVYLKSLHSQVCDACTYNTPGVIDFIYIGAQEGIFSIFAALLNEVDEGCRMSKKTKLKCVTLRAMK